MEKTKKIFYLLNKKEKKNFFFVLFLILLMAFFDTIGVVSILPFIALLSNPGLIDTNIFLSKIYKFSFIFGVQQIEDFFFFLGIFVFLLLILSLTIRSITVYFQYNFVLMLEYSVSRRLIEKYLHQPYSWFLNRNSADLGKNILSEVDIVIKGTMIPFITLIAQGMVALGLLTMLFIFDPLLTLAVGMIFASSYALIFFFMKNVLKKLGIERLNANEKRFKTMTESFGAIKETKFLGLEDIYVERFSSPAKTYAKNISIATVIGQVPRNFIEGLAFGGMIILILYLMLGGKNFMSIIPLVALYAFAGYRLMPALQQIYSSFTTMKFSDAGLNNLYRDLSTLKIDEKNFISEEIKFTNSIRLENVDFSYPESDNKILKKINVLINHNTKVGFIGKTGSGKTTTIDIIMGLLNPLNGKLTVDDKTIKNSNKRYWQKKIGYVPQQIYLRDATISENIAFGINKDQINIEAVVNASKIANLHEFVTNKLPNGYNTVVGERGIRLSGGQKQRIGIARALYSNPSLVIFDEATNALDNKTEDDVMKAIDRLGNKKTIIVVAHRLSTVENCDQIYLFENGEIKKHGKFKELELEKNSKI